MNGPSLRNPSYLSLTDQQLSKIDELCDRFDRELLNGDAPRIEAFLAEAPEAARDGLLAELLAMEFEYRSQQGDQPRPDEYFQRFPEQKGFIGRVFARDTTTHYSGKGTISLPVSVPPVLASFRLIEVLGRGGMGVVWLAEQDEPVKRRVALKLIKADLNSKNVLARFDAEKQALAMMDHPNIARVLDAGTTDDGRPYFVMELVDGVPITQYCDDNKLSVDERLKLFGSVCKAVQHAHQKGIIHRDLKPSNVLVTVIDGEAVPKVIDFGLAKAVEQNLLLSDVTMQTEFGKVVGTVQYMSPEQAELRGPDAEDIDTRTDVYSLGVMLYELLTGSTPLDKDTLGTNALLEVLQIIREEDPPRPSSRLSSSSHEANSAVSDIRVAFAPSGEQIAAACGDRSIHLWSARPDREVTALTGHSNPVRHATFSLDGKRIYSESMNEKFVWDVAAGKQIENAEWNPAVERRRVSPDGRWFVTSEFNHVLLVDREFQNTPHEKAYRAGKARFDPAWHQEQANAATTAKNWYAAAFHYALLVKNDPDQASYYDGRQSSLLELKLQYEQEGRDLEPYLATVVKQTLKLSPDDERANPSFEEPPIRTRSFEFRRTVPGWKTTGNMFEIWSSGFQDVTAHDGDQFVEINANEEGTLRQDQLGIEKDAVIEFSFAHRGRNGEDTLKLTITDLGPDNADGGGDDTELFSKEYTTGNSDWAVYDSTTEPTITALGNKVCFVYRPVSATSGRVPGSAEGNFLDAVYLGVGVVTAKSNLQGVKRLQALLVGGDQSQKHYLGMKEGNVGIPVETNSNGECIFILKVERNDDFAILTNSDGKYLTAQGEDVVLTDALEPGSRWVIRYPLKTDLNPNEGWFSLESASDRGRYLRHYSLSAYAHKKSELTSGPSALFLSDASWKFVDAQ